MGYKNSYKLILYASENCGKERWVRLVKGKPTNEKCHECAVRRGGGGNAWGDGKYRATDGYFWVRIYSDDFFYPMANCRGYVREHRLVVAKALGRCLHPWEIVHHKKGYAKDDNRYPETLQLVSDTRHNQITILENKIRRLEEKGEKQNKLIKLLQWQMKERRNVTNL